MNRPDDFTPDMKAAADAEIARFRVEQQQPGWTGHRVPDCLFLIPHFVEHWYCGAWLNIQLTALGCPEPFMRSICFANGQRCAMAADPWIPTRQTLAQYLAGHTDQPGAGLANRLCREAGLIPDDERTGS